ncbi:MAG: hypothetical protein Q4C13_08410 [Clostridia bacterium]|nr:hypothetical protein [Clostridia bacterium]
MKDLEKLGESIARSGKAGELKSIADSAEGQAIQRLLDPAAVERAAKSGDAAALQGILDQVLSTDEGKRLAESIKKALQ